MAIGGAAVLAVPLIAGSPYTINQNYIDNYPVPAWEKPVIYNNDAVAGRVSDILQYTLVGFAALSTGVFTHFRWKQWRVSLVMYAEAFLWQQGIVQCFKTFVGRPRPYTYSDNFTNPNPGPSDIASFISGHSTAAFMSAFFIGKTYSDIYPHSEGKIGVWTLGISAAAICGGFRIASGAHFPTDVLAGAAWGAAVGYLIPVLHKRKIMLGKNKHISLHFTPLAGDQFYGLQMKFRFY